MMGWPASFVGNFYQGIRKLLIVMYWKNLTLKLRHYILTLLEILIPTLLFAALLAIYLVAGGGFTPTFKPAEVFQKQLPLWEICRS